MVFWCCEWISINRNLMLLMICKLLVCGVLNIWQLHCTNSYLNLEEWITFPTRWHTRERTTLIYFFQRTPPNLENNSILEDNSLWRTTSFKNYTFISEDNPTKKDSSIWEDNPILEDIPTLEYNPIFRKKPHFGRQPHLGGPPLFGGQPVRRTTLFRRNPRFGG